MGQRIRVRYITCWNQKGYPNRSDLSPPTASNLTLSMAFSFAQSTFFSKPSLFLHKNGFRSFAFSLSFSPCFSTSAVVYSGKIPHHKWRQPVVASVLELGGVKIAKEGNLPTFQNCIFVTYFCWIFHCYFCKTVCSENPVSDGFQFLPSWFVKFWFFFLFCFGIWLSGLDGNFIF